MKMRVECAECKVTVSEFDHICIKEIKKFTREQAEEIKTWWRDGEHKSKGEGFTHEPCLSKFEIWLDQNTEK